ncbi:MAG: hypothetical protein JKX85_11855 [Phycisphaeraceae bacterium]|nr:hypothetical protein [Phycisphaeraceae bacterium]
MNPCKRRKPHGHALLLTLLILLLTAAAAFGVLSIGRHARVKEMTSFSAKEGADSGASWIARSLNTVAMNNQAMANLIVQAGLINASPTAIDLSAKDLQAVNKLLKQLDIQKLPRDWQPIENDNPVAMYFNNLKQITIKELKKTQAAKKFITKNISSADIHNITYARPNDKSNNTGSIWQAISTLDEINQAILENLEIQTQLSVLRGSILDTTARQTEASALLLPTDQLVVPWQRGVFDDFKSVIFKDHTYQSETDIYEPFTRHDLQTLNILTTKLGSPKGPRGKCPISIKRASIPKAHSRRYWQDEPQLSTTVKRPAVEDMALFRKIGSIASRMHHKRLATHLAKINRQQLAQLWPDKSRPIKPIYDSKWVTDLDQIFQIMTNQPQRIREVAFITVEIKSAYEPSNPKFKSHGSWKLLNRHTSKALNVEYYPWDKNLNPKSWGKKGIKQLHPRIWREIWHYNVLQDRSINLKLLPKETNNKHPRQPIYRIDDYLLLGINVGEPLKISSPYNFSKNSPKPAPMLYVETSQTQPLSDQIQRTVVAMNHLRHLPWASPTAPTETAPTMLAPYDLHVSNANNRTLWHQGWLGTAVANPHPDLSHAVVSTELQPLISGKLYESVLSELQTKIELSKQEDPTH